MTLNIKFKFMKYNLEWNKYNILTIFPLLKFYNLLNHKNLLILES
jgi:hypothetical protein